MAIIINLTPHALNVIDAAGNCILTVPASGQLARCHQVTTPGADVEIEGVLIPTGSNQFGEIQGLPDEKEGTLLFRFCSGSYGCMGAGQKRRGVPISGGKR